MNPAAAGSRYALSVKQPWAALLLHGLKTIEVRKWPTAIRGPILLHAAKVASEDPVGWRLLPEEFRPTADLRGGIIGELELVECRLYASPDAFQRDAALHGNLPDWFVPPRMFGFVMRNPRPRPFAPWLGNVRFFTVPLAELADAPAGSSRPVPSVSSG